MIERWFYKALGEELTRRGFFMATDYPPEFCIELAGLAEEEKRAYVENLQENYRLVAVKNFLFVAGIRGEECAVGWQEVLAGSRTKEPYPMVFVTLRYGGRYYKMAYRCRVEPPYVEGNDYGEKEVRNVVDGIRRATEALLEVLDVWITEGKFPLHRFAEGTEEPIMD